MAAVAERLHRRGAEALASVSLPRRMEVWNGAVEALLDPESRERRALMPSLIESCRLSPEGLSEALEIVLGGWRGSDAERLAERAAGSGAADRRGAGGVVLAGNVPGLAAQCLLPALAVGRPLLIKSASSEPLFAAALVGALAAREPALGEAFAAMTFPGSDEELTRAAFARSEVVLAFGGNDALGGLRSILGDRLVAQGPKASVALVGGDDVEPLAVGRALARDVALLDQRGCLSVHAVFVQGDAYELAEALAYGLSIEHRRLPPGPPDDAALAAVQQARGEAELRGARVGGLAALEGSVILAPGLDFRPSPGLRCVRVHAVASFGEAVEALAPWRGLLQGAALAGERAWAVWPELAELGISRVARAGQLQAAGAGWANGGIDPLAVFD